MFKYLLLALIPPSLALAQATPDPPSVLDPTEADPAAGEVTQARKARLFTLYFENDTFGGTDQNYTNGTKLSWMTGDLTEWGQPGWRQHIIEALPFINRPDTAKNIAFSLGQQIYTPFDHQRTNPDPLDRPYAGWSYLEFSFISKNSHRADIFSLQLGIVGPASLADDTQRLVHKWTDDPFPAGWGYQLRNEPGVNLLYERRYRIGRRTLGNTLGADFVSHGGVSVGNIQTHANLGFTVRIGVNLPSDFGVQLARGSSIGAPPVDDLDPRVAAEDSAGFFLFAGADGRAIARDIFLDGNTWKDSRSVEKRAFVADLQTGFGLITGRWQLTGSFVHRSREFKTQPDPRSRFGSITLSMTF